MARMRGNMTSNNHEVIDHEITLTPAENLESLAHQYNQDPTDTNRQALVNAVMRWQAEDAHNVTVRPVTDWKDAPEPASVLWRDGHGTATGYGSDPVLSAGETAVLSGAGGSGKSFIALALAAAACGWNEGKTCGLVVRSGPAVLVGYEDAPGRVFNRLRLMTGENGKIPEAVGEGVHLADNPPPLMIGDPRRPGTCAPCTAWPKLWDALDGIRPSLVVIDPVSVALSANQNDAAVVRAFLSAVTTEATKIGAGVLLIAHSTKAARDELRTGSNPGAGAIAGSGQWHDGARGVLSLYGVSGGKVLECIKSNYGQQGWAALLKDNVRDRTFAGYALEKMLEDEEAVKKAKQGTGVDVDDEKTGV